MAGSSEIRGDLLLRKANGTAKGNEGNNLNLKLDNSTYTELDTKIENGNIRIMAQQKPTLMNSITPANIIFNARNVGINTTNPEATLHVEK